MQWDPTRVSGIHAVAGRCWWCVDPTSWIPRAGSEIPRAGSEIPCAGSRIPDCGILTSASEAGRLGAYGFLLIRVLVYPQLAMRIDSANGMRSGTERGEGRGEGGCGI